MKCRDGGKTLAEWHMYRAREVSQGIEEAGGNALSALQEVEHDDEVMSGDEEMEDAFESMANFNEADHGKQQSRNGSSRKIRATPVMTIYFARVPVPGLKELYGYATISFIDANH